MRPAASASHGRFRRVANEAPDRRAGISVTTVYGIGQAVQANIGPNSTNVGGTLLDCYMLNTTAGAELQIDTQSSSCGSDAAIIAKPRKTRIGATTMAASGSSHLLAVLLWATAAFRAARC